MECKQRKLFYTTHYLNSVNTEKVLTKKRV